MKIPNTPGSELLKRVKKKVENVTLPKNLKIMFREDNGEKIAHKIVNSHKIAGDQPCGRVDCFACQPEVNKKTNCWKTGVTYQIKCNPCLQAGKLAIYRRENIKGSL